MFDILALGGQDTPGSRASSNQKSTSTSTPLEIDSQAEFPTELQKTYQHLTVPHKIIIWPSIHTHLTKSGIKAAPDLQYVLQGGTPWFLRLEMTKHALPLPSAQRLPYYALNTAAHEQHEHGSSSNVAFPSLTIQQIQQRCEAYFNTYNALLPLLNRDAFMNDVVAPLFRDGYPNGESTPCLHSSSLRWERLQLTGSFNGPSPPHKDNRAGSEAAA